jgi:hypothetical protein
MPADLVLGADLQALSHAPSAGQRGRPDRDAADDVPVRRADWSVRGMRC